MTAIRLYLAIAMLRTANRLQGAAGRLVRAVEYNEPGLHRAELVLFALFLAVAVLGIWIGRSA
ncbi:hypothetical protein [Mesorhizobium marinum]|uniref:hypothetical protein n=1 Tax=Mesorhizobium marinum TaxID=3228790 RepID=UPI0034674496